MDDFDALIEEIKKEVEENERRAAYRRSNPPLILNQPAYKSFKREERKKKWRRLLDTNLVPGAEVGTTLDDILMGVGFVLVVITSMVTASLWLTYGINNFLR